MKRGAREHPALDVSAEAVERDCPAFRFAPYRFDRPVHRSVGPDQVASFAYRDRGGATAVVNVSNLLEGTARAGALLDVLGLGGVDPGAFA